MYYNKLVLSDGSVLFSNIISASLTTTCMSGNDIEPGSVCASSVDVEFWVRSDEEFSITQGTTFTYYKVDDSGVETKIGVFTCEKPEKDGQNQYKFTAYDNVTLLDKDVSNWVNNKVSFPITLSDFASSLAKECGLSLANDVFVNGSYKIQKFTASNVTGRDLMKFVCQAGGCFGFANSDGNIEFGWFKENDFVKVAPSAKPPVYLRLYDSGSVSLFDSGNVALYSYIYEKESVPYYSGGLTYSDYTVSQIDKVQIKQSDDDVGVIYPADETKKNAIVIQGNILLSATSDEQIRPCAQALYEHLKDIVYVPCSSISVPETLGIKFGDILEVTDGKKSFKTWVTSVKYSGGKCEISSVGNATRTGTSAVNEASFNAKQKYLEIKASIDGFNVKAGQLESDYTQLSQTVDGLNISVVKNGEVRTKFAADASSVKIKSGLVEFDANTIAIQSTNFSLDSSGNVVATGTFGTNNGVSGNGRNEAVLSSGSLSLYRTNSAGKSNIVANIYGVGQNASLGNIILYGPDASNNQINQFLVTTDFTGSRLSMRNAANTQTVIFNASSGDAQISGSMDFQGDRGIGVNGTVSCQNLDCWGSKKRIVKTSFGNLSMSAFETPEPLFADCGSAQCDEYGLCYIMLNPKFAETISCIKETKWIVTPYDGYGNLWVEKDESLSGGAIIHGGKNQKFDWICIGAQKDFDKEYAEVSDSYEPQKKNESYAQLDYVDSVLFEEEKNSQYLEDFSFFDYKENVSNLLFEIEASENQDDSEDTK